MATGAALAQTGTNNPQAAAILRANQMAAKRGLPRQQDAFSNRAPSNVFQESSWTQDSNREVLDNIPEPVSRAEAALEPQERFRAEEQRQKILQATRRDVLIARPAEDFSSEAEVDYEMEESEYEEQISDIEGAMERLQMRSRETDVENLAPLRGQLRRLGDLAAEKGAQKVKEEAAKKAAQFGIKIGVNGANLLDTPGEDGWITYFLTFAYNCIRAGLTVLIPDPDTINTSSVSSTSKYTASKTLSLVFPRYKLLSLDFAYFILQLVLLGVVLALISVIFILIFSFAAAAFGFTTYLFDSLFTYIGL